MIHLLTVTTFRCSSLPDLFSIWLRKKNILPAHIGSNWLCLQQHCRSQEQQLNYFNYSTKFKMWGWFRETETKSGNMTDAEDGQASVWFGCVCVTCRSNCTHKVLLKQTDVSSEIFLELISWNHTDCSQQKINLIFCQSGCQLLKIWSLPFFSHFSPPSLSRLS